MAYALPDTLIPRLEKKGVTFESGLTDSEVGLIEERFTFTFPEDLRVFLQTALPVSGRFAPWRAALASPTVAKDLATRMNEPLEGLLHSLKQGFFWHEPWGIKPHSFAEQKEVLLRHWPQVPKLISIWGHRYLPETPSLPHNPVFSVVGSDIIYYGNDLVHYFEQEFTLPWRYGEKPPNR